MKKTRKGFTLVELLIVIVVIGILSAMMMLSSTEAVTSAKASNIVSNLRNLKTAALAYYVDNMDSITTTTKNTEVKDGMLKYLNSGTSIPDIAKYTVSLTNNNNAKDSTWFIKYSIDGTDEEKNKIKDKLKGRASSTGLLKNAAVSNGEIDTTPYEGGADVYMLIR